VRTEHQEQVILVARIRQFLRGVLVFAVPNGGKRGKREAARLKAEGVLAGVPDLVIAEPRGGFHGMCVELKREKGGRTSKAQKEVIAGLRARGYHVVVSAGADEAFRQIETYLALPPGARAVLS